MFEKDLPETTMNRIKGMAEIRDCTRKLIELQVDDSSDIEIKEEQERLNRLYDNFEERKYVTADEYLSGNVREKFNIAKIVAERNPEFETNVRELEKVIPKDIKASEISVKPGATWIPPEYIEQFIYELLDTDYWDRKKIKVHYSDYTTQWNITGKSVDRGIKATKTYGVKKASAYKIIESALNLNDIKIYKKIIDVESGEEKSVIDKQQTAIAQAKQDEIRMKFEEWIFKNPDRREKLVKLYNEKFNSVRNRQYDGSYLKFYGMNPEIKLREHGKTQKKRNLHSLCFATYLHLN